MTKGKDEAAEGPPFRKSTAREYFESICVAVILALFVRTFVVQAFKIPTGSMENNLLIGDHLLVNKFVFAPTPLAIGRAGPPGRPPPLRVGGPCRGNVFVCAPPPPPSAGGGLPVRPIRRGDIVVFKYPDEPERDFI